MFEKTQINPRTIAKHISYCPVPAWELMKADFDVEMKKEETSHILSYSVKSHIDDSYSNHFKMSTDESVSENECASGWLVIPEFKTGEREREKKKEKRKKLLHLYIYCRISCVRNDFVTPTFFQALDRITT